jgi:hypothetical protein
MAIDPRGGLSSLVSSEAENMYGMPQPALEQRAKVAGATMDAIVARKALEMKKQAKAALDAETQPNPDTIVAQNEKALMDSIQQETSGTLADLTKRTQGTMAQKQRVQGQNLKRAAAGTPRPPQQPQRRPMPPQAQGLAGARMAQAAQAGGPKMMAQGGIVGFAEGGKTNKELGYGGRALARIEDLGITKQQFDAMDATQQQKIVQLINDRNRLASAGNTAAVPAAMAADVLSAPAIFAQNAGNYLAETRAGQALGLSDPTQPPAERIPYMGVTKALEERAGTNLSDLAGIQSVLSPAQVSSMLPSGTPPTPIAPTAPTEQTGPMPVVPPSPTSPVPPSPTPAPAVTKDVAPDPADQGLGGLENTPQTAGTVGLPDLTTENRTNVDEAVQAGFAQMDAQSNRDSNIASMEERLAALDKYDAETYRTPEEQASREIQSFLVGMGGTGSLGAAMRGGMAAMSNEERISRSNGRDRLMDKFNKQKEIVGADAVFSEMGLNLAKQFASDAAENERNVRTNATELTKAQMRQATADADRLSNREKTLLDAADKKVARQLEASKNKGYNDRTRLQAALAVQADIDETRSALYTSETENNQLLVGLKLELADRDISPEKETEINRKIRQEEAVINIKVNKAMNDRGLLDRETMARQITESLLDLDSDLEITNVDETP